jgi:DNA repair protein RAD51
MISTGSTDLDKILGGGLQRTHLTQVYGEFRSGKSMLAHTMLMTAQKPAESGGGCGRALFIDTEGTFDENKLLKIAEAHELDVTQALSNIDYCRVYNYEDLNQTIQDASLLLVEGLHSLIIVDSIAAPFRNEFLGRGELSVRQQELQRTLTFLQKTVDEFNLACLVTNQVMANPEGGGMPGADPRRAVLGYCLSHRTQTAMYLKKGAGEKRICKLICSPTMPEADAEICISVRARVYRARHRPRARPLSLTCGALLARVVRAHPARRRRASATTTSEPGGRARARGSVGPLALGASVESRMKGSIAR